MAKIKKQKAKLSECCKSPMIGGVQCENCGSDGKFTTGTAIVKRLDEILKAIKPIKTIVTKGAERGTQERFIDNGDGTISDTREITLSSGKKVKLMWQKEGSKERMEWKNTEDYCKKSDVAGHNDWRMPEVEELFSLVDFTKREPAINPMFKCESAGYWSATKYVYAALPDGFAWSVNFYDGNVFNVNRYVGYYVRPCRQY